MLLCGMCPKYFRSKASLALHRRFAHSGSLRGGNEQFQRVVTAHRKACEVYRLILPQNIREASRAIRFGLPRLRPLIQRLLTEKRNMRVSIALTVRFHKAQDNIEGSEAAVDDPIGVEGVDVLTVPMASSFHVIRYQGGEEQQQVAQMLDEINQTLDAFVHNGSGWVQTDVLTMDLQVMECMSLVGSCSSHHVTYERRIGIMIKHAEDDPHLHNGDRCFFRAVSKALLYQLGEHFPSEQRIEEFAHAEICENIPAPVDVKDIGKFEAGNPHLDLAINVLYQDESGSEVFPARASPRLNAHHQVNLMLFHMAPPPDQEHHQLQEDEEQDHCQQQQSKPIMHYAWISNLGDVIGVRKKSQNGYRYKHDKHLCFNCFLQFHSHHALANHADWCHREQGQRKILPEEGECVRYSQRQHEVKMPWFFVFDFETLQIEPEAQCSCKPDQRTKCEHKTHILAEQKPFAYGLLMVDKSGLVCEDIHYIGEDAADHFIDTVLTLSDKYADILEKSYVPLKTTPEIEKEFEDAEDCYICGDPFHYDKVRDHDHLTGKNNMRDISLSFYTLINFI